MTRRLVTLRASSLPLAFRCPGSTVPPKVRIDPYNAAGETGTGAHEALRPLAEGRRINWELVGELAARYGVHEGELRALLGAAQKLWEEVRDSFPGALTEAAVEAEFHGVKLTGHVDLLSISARVARSGDWKSGRKDTDYSQQLRGYAALVHAVAPEPLDEVTSTALWLRTKEIENYTMDRAEYLRWQDEFRVRIIEWDGVYHPGQHCGYCPRQHECEAGREYLRAAVAVVVDRNHLGRIECEIERFSPDELIDIVSKCTIVAQYAERARDAIKQHVAKVGDIEGSKARLTLDTRNERTIDPLAAWPVLEAAGFTDDDFAGVVKLSASRVDKCVAAKTPRGGKGAAIAELNKRLEDAGALTRTETTYLTIRRT